MDKLLKHAASVWNPVASVRERRSDGTLTLASVFPTFVGIAIACSLAYSAAEGFYFNPLKSVLGENSKASITRYCSPSRARFGPS